jgi:hypothetical protein
MLGIALLLELVELLFGLSNCMALVDLDSLQQLADHKD